MWTSQSRTIILSLTFENCCNEEYIAEIKNILGDSQYEIETSLINQYEYRGIKKVWHIAEKYPKSEILYFHSKGIVFRNESGIRTLHERILFNNVIKQWKFVLQVLQTNPPINKVGLICSRRGSIWFNFWWARASYILDLREPILTTNRFYYERYLGKRFRGPITDKDCYNLYDNSIGLGLKSESANTLIDDVILKITDDWMPHS